MSSLDDLNLTGCPVVEYRFILPVLPLLLMYAGKCLDQLQRHVRFRSAFKAMICLVFLTNVLAGYYFSRWHQVRHLQTF